MFNSSGRVFGFLPPTGVGSLGDQAMLDAATTHVAETLGGKPIVMLHAPTLRSNAQVLSGASAAGKIGAIARGVTRSSHVVYVGADVLDGVYHAQSSLNRLRVLWLAHRLGRRTRIMGSSWSRTPAPSVANFLKNASWLEVFARDAVSQRRLEALLERDVRLVADLGFLLKEAATSPSSQAAVDWARAAKASGATVLGANLSGHTVAKLPGRDIAPFIAVLSKWLETDPARRVLVLPHDTRKGYVGDLKVCGDLATALSERFGERVYLPEQNLEAWEAKAIAAEVDLVLTGRMHLAIASLGVGTPPLCVVYQGKFEGLMQHFDQDGLLMQPDDVAAGGETTERLEMLTANAIARRMSIQSALPRVTALSASNFDGL